MFHNLLAIFILSLGSAALTHATQQPDPKDSQEAVDAAQQYPILSMRERAAMIDTMLADRLDNVLPDLMAREGIDMWVLVSREYNEDPVLKTMLPATWLSARRRTILVLFNPGEGKPVERLAVARYNVDSLFAKTWDKEKQPDQWQALLALIKQKNPSKIGINISKHYGLADGLNATEYQEFTAALDKFSAEKIVSGEKLAIGWLETRSKLEMQLYPQLTAIGHDLIKRAFSNEVITPGITTTEDVVWWLREQTRELKLSTWFHPSVSLQRARQYDSEKWDPAKELSQGQVIQPGDLLHVDFGLVYLRLHSDQQQHAYVLKSDEVEAPLFLQKALAIGNRLQDIFTANFAQGRTGNEVLKLSRQQAIAENIKPTIYTHPIGFHGHAAGTTLGMWDSQDGVPVQGDYPLHYNTAYSIELNAAVFVEEWHKEIRIMLEEQAYFDQQGVQYIDGRQRQLHLISSQ
ncbi:M24 family metallopeptidase [Aliiglaciecola sp. LCG003]|uniref:M24 family metallopeptidase n=1 Tax=Aliiglaciecola sp. LCG003 TaxID=3053655 RepID=UPI0025742E10|nr:M24 family metallopeptidase [Aliiglaciecola sp. LCG003]WJG07838.1 M24 family metallopeptidase [Aliiglaciecola sp. LCG003]